MTDDAEPEQTAVNDSRTDAVSDTPLTRSSSRDVHGWTYFLEHSGLIKIGFTARPRQRLEEHRRKHPNLKVLAVVPISVAGEFETHQRFDHLRVDGREMFRPEPELYAFIAKAKAAAKASDVSKAMSDLTVLRNKHKASSPIGHHCSNIMRLMQMPSPPAHLLKMQMAGLQRAMQAVQ